MENIDNLILENRKLVYKLASYFPYYHAKEDLIQAGFKGMAIAYQNYDETKGVKFTSYAYHYILGEMKSLISNDKSLKVNRETIHLNSQIDKARTMLEQTLMRSPTNEELSEYLEVSPLELEMALNSTKNVQSIDAAVGDTSMMLEEIISAPSVDIDTLISLKTELEHLKEPDRTIMIRRYYEDMTQAEVANALGLSQVDISRREKKVLTKIRNKISA